MPGRSLLVAKSQLPSCAIAVRDPRCRALTYAPRRPRRKAQTRAQRRPFAQSATELGWMPYCMAACPGVLSPLSASRTAWNLNFAEYRFLVITIASSWPSPSRSMHQISSSSTPHHRNVQFSGVSTQVVTISHLTRCASHISAPRL